MSRAYWRHLPLIIPLLLCVALLATAQEYYPSMRYGKRDEQVTAGGIRRSFTAGSRFGRSGGLPVVVAPRSNQFLLGTRFGKRGLGLDQSAGAEADLDDRRDVGSQQTSPCKYSGYSNVYLCSGSALEQPTSEV